jgi:hypothetical protein
LIDTQQSKADHFLYSTSINGYLMRSLLVTTVMASTVAAVLLIGGCSDASNPTGTSNDDPTPITGTYYIQAKINGKTETMQNQQGPNGLTQQYFSGSNGGDDLPDKYGVIQENGFVRSKIEGTRLVNDTSFHTIRIILVKLFDDRPYDDEVDQILPFTGSMAFGGADDFKDGVEIRWTDAAGKQWSSSFGAADQTGSNFAVTSREAIVPPDNYLGPPLPHFKVKGTFNCKLYDGKGNSIDLTNGIFHLQMIYEV